MPETRILIVRHGETEWNLEGRVQGHLDSPLTDLGVKQAEAAAEALLSESIDLLVSSDLLRARKTAEIISSRLGMGALIDARLRERNLGSVQGFTKDELQQQHPVEFESFPSSGPDHAYPGGETTRQHVDRIVACLTDLAEEHTGKHIAVVTHGGSVSCFLRYVLDLPMDRPRRFSLFNACFSRFTLTGDQWRLDSWGEVHHLRHLGTIDDW